MFAIPPIQPLDLPSTKTALAVEDNRIGERPLLGVGQIGWVSGCRIDSVLPLFVRNGGGFGHLFNFFGQRVMEKTGALVNH